MESGPGISNDSVQGPPPPLPPAWRWAGPVLSLPFGAAVVARRLAYRCGWIKPQRASIPVISVGNLTAGGTGKTPAVAYLARGLLVRKRKPAILMRGYGASAPGELNDEAMELTRALPQVPVLVNPDRCAGARQAAERGCDVVLLDDGFQHWRLERDLDVVLLDATDPFGGGHLLPWGRLRERARALSRAGVVIVTRSDLVTSEALANLERAIETFSPGAFQCKSHHQPKSLRRLFGPSASESPEALRGKRIVAACGIGAPHAFHATLARLGANILGELTYPDHFDYRSGGLHAFEVASGEWKPDWIVVTEKDAAKLEALSVSAPSLPPVWALGIDFKVDEGAEQLLWIQIEKVLSKRME